jgi:hypothetical protein
MQGTLSVVKLTEPDTYRLIFYGTEIPEGLDPAAAYVARGNQALGSVLTAIGIHADKQQAIRDALRFESSTSVFNCDVPDDVLKRFGLA